MPKSSKEDPKKGILEANISLRGVNITQKLVFARYLSVMLKSGLTISESLDIIHNQSTGKFKNVVKAVLKSVEAGNSLSASLKKFSKVFPSLFISATYAGEVSGTLEKNLSNVAEQLRSEKELASKIKSAMVYPVIVIIATMVLGLAMAFFVLPKITPLFEGLKMELPLTTRLLIWVSNQIQAHGLLIFGGVVFLVALFFWLSKREFVRPFTHWFFLHAPIIKNISRNANLARFCQTLGTLLKSGLNIDEAFNITVDTVENYHYKTRLSKVSQRIGQGTKISENLEIYDKYFPRLVTSMIKVGERSGNLEGSLFYLAEFYEIEVDNATKSLSTAIEPILLIFIGLAVGVMALSIVTPIYQITGNIQR